MTKLVAIMGGGDWADASVEHLEIPDDMNLKEQREAYILWWHSLDNKDDKSFVEFLKERGAIETNKVEEFWEY